MSSLQEKITETVCMFVDISINIGNVIITCGAVIEKQDVVFQL